MTVLDPNRAFAARVGIPAGGTVVAQARRAGGSSLVVTFTNSSQPVAELDQSGGLNGAQVQTAAIVAGSFDTPAGSVEFDPLGTGTTSVTAALTGFVAAGATVMVTVSTPDITVSAPATVGGGLQAGGGLTLLASQHGGVVVRIESKDLSRILIAPNVTTVGQPFIEVPVANGSQTVNFVVQATDWVVGSSAAAEAVVEVSAPGFTKGTDTVNYVQPAIGIVSLPASLNSLGPNHAFAARVGIPAGGTVVAQARRAGGSDVVATFTSSNPAVGELDGPGGTTGQAQQTLAIAAGAFDTPSGAGGVQFDPLTAGSTTVTVTSTSQFLAVGGATVTVTVSP